MTNATTVARAVAREAQARAKTALADVLAANQPLASASLIAAVASTTLDSGTLEKVLIDNSPLAPEVLDAALNRMPPLSAAGLVGLLTAQ